MSSSDVMQVLVFIIGFIIGLVIGLQMVKLPNKEKEEEIPIKNHDEYLVSEEDYQIIQKIKKEAKELQEAEELENKQLAEEAKEITKGFNK